MAESGNPFRCVSSAPEVIASWDPLSLRNVEHLLFERGIDISYETVCLWWNRFGPKSPLRSAASESTV
jgi:putative transposase